jgi:recombination protein RecT
MNNAVIVIDPNDKLNTAIEKLTPSFEAALPSHIPVEKFKRVLLTAVQQTPALQNADRKSLFLACQRAASDGLLPDGREAALVMFKNNVQYMPMIAGILKKIRNSGELSTIAAHVVHRNDKFRYVLGDDERIEHEPFMGDDRGEAVAVYAVAKTKDGGIYREVMSKVEVEKVRAVSRASGAGPWSQWWGEMARKTVLRRLSKRLPMSTDMEALLRADDDDAPVLPAAPRPVLGDAPAPTPDPVEWPFVGTDGTETMCADHAEWTDRFLAEIEANKTNAATLEGIWESNSPLLTAVRALDDAMAEQPHAAMTAAKAALAMVDTKAKGWTFVDAKGKRQTVKTEAEFVTAMTASIKAEGFAPPAMKALWGGNAEMLARLDVSSPEAHATLHKAAIDNGLEE